MKTVTLSILFCFCMVGAVFGQNNCPAYGVGEYTDNTTCTGFFWTCVTVRNNPTDVCVAGCLYQDTDVIAQDNTHHAEHKSMGQVCSTSDVVNGQYSPVAVTCPAGQGSDVLTGECKPLSCDTDYSLLCSIGFCICSGGTNGSPTDYSKPSTPALNANNALSPRDGTDVISSMDDGTLNSVAHFQLPGHSSTCPTPTLNLFGKDYLMNSHCILAGQYSDVISIVCVLCWSLSGFVIVMKA